MPDGSSRKRAFVFVVCGPEKHVRTLHRSLDYLKARTELPVIVVTDTTRNRVPIRNDRIVDVRTPEGLDDHRASILLKTGLHRLLPGHQEYCYLDSDVLAVGESVDSVFDQRRGPVTFARDLTRLEGRVETFSPWAVHCECSGQRGDACGHLVQAIERKFRLRVRQDWPNWNGGVFLFDDGSRRFLETWRRTILKIFEDPYWKTRDQGALIVTVWKLGLESQPCLPHRYNFIVDFNNADLCFESGKGYAVHHSIPPVRPEFLHLYHSALEEEGWTLAADVEERISAQTQARADAREHARRRDREFLTTVDRSPVASRRGAGPGSVQPSDQPRSFKPPGRTRRAGASPPLGEGVQVVVGASSYMLSGASCWAASLVNGLAARKVAAHVLLTEEGSERVASREPRLPPPPDLQLEQLPVEPSASWGSRWGAVVDYLERRAPCIYLPGNDWRHSVVSAVLSPSVSIVGTVRGDHPGYRDQAERLGRYWNATVTTSVGGARELIARSPGLAERVFTIPVGVSVPAVVPTRSARDRLTLRVVHHGRLTTQRQRILDIHAILRLLDERRVPVELTMIGDGAERRLLESQCQDLVERGLVRFLGVLPHVRTLSALEDHDVYVSTSDCEGTGSGLVEAMARGCVPVTTDVHSRGTDLVQDGVNGFLVPAGDVDGFARRLADLQTDRELCQRLAVAAHRAVIESGRRIEDMIDGYVDLFHWVLHEGASVFRRTRGLLRKPPYQVAGHIVFPVPYSRGIEGVGVFPSYREDYEDYRAALKSSPAHQLEPWSPELVRPYPVVVSGARRRDSPQREFAETLLSGLGELDQPGFLLLDAGDEDAHEPVPLATGICVERLDSRGAATSPEGWRNLVEYLEERSPCIYFPNDAYFPWCPSAILPEAVAVIGVVRSSDPERLAHVARFGPYWNAVVAVSPAIAAQVSRMSPALAGRLVAIPSGVVVPDLLPERPLDWDRPLRVVAHARGLAREPERRRDVSRLLAEIERRGTPLELTIIDDAPEPWRLERGWRWKAELRAPVVVVGNANSAGVRGIYETSDVLLQTSSWGCQPPKSLLEAMGRGCIPVIACQTGFDAGPLVDGGNGYLVPPGDVRALAERLIALQQNAALRRAVAVESHRTIQEGMYNARDTLGSYMLLFERVLREAESGEYRRPPRPVEAPETGSGLR